MTPTYVWRDGWLWALDAKLTGRSWAVRWTRLATLRGRIEPAGCDSDGTRLVRVVGANYRAQVFDFTMPAHHAKVPRRLEVSLARAGVGVGCIILPGRGRATIRALEAEGRRHRVSVHS